MPKTFYTDHDIEDLAKKGVRTLRIDRHAAFLTELAIEKAERLGLKIIFEVDTHPENDSVSPFTPAGTAEKQSVVSEMPEVPVQKQDFDRNHLCFSPDASEAELRDAIIQAGRQAYQGGLMVANDGNISVMMNDGNVLITP